MGHLIPAGTGFITHRSINLIELGEPVGEPVIFREKREGDEAAAAERSKLELAQALG